MSDTDRETPKIARGAAREVAAWDGLARHYDLIVRALGARYDVAAVRMRTIIAGKARVIEVAAGTGLFTREIAKVAVQVVATDFSASTLAMIDKRLASERITNVQTFQRDACDLGFPSETFDAAVCANALHVIPEPVAALREIHRVLVPKRRPRRADVLSRRDGRVAIRVAAPERGVGVPRAHAVHRREPAHDGRGAGLRGPDLRRPRWALAARVSGGKASLRVGGDHLPPAPRLATRAKESQCAPGDEPVPPHSHLDRPFVGRVLFRQLGAVSELRRLLIHFIG
jgi:SAM-dependent methyltransferase